MELNPEELDPRQIGTRAKGTESLVYRILQTPAYRTREIVTRLLEAALVAPTAHRDLMAESEADIYVRAENIIARIKKAEATGDPVKIDRAIPKNELDLVA